MRAGAVLVVLLGCAAPEPGAPPPAAPRPPEAPATPGAPARAMPATHDRGAHVLRLGASRLRVHLDGDRFELGAAPILDWVSRAARAVEAYYGVFPVPEAVLIVHAADGSKVRGGHTQPGAPPRIDIRVGVHATRRDLARNWSLTHELVHLAFPNLRRRHLWLEEGLASYVEPLARARAGALEEEDVWREWLDNLAIGLPQPGDRGLDHTPTWARRYWGGALFCFLADLELRRRSGGRVELRDALRAIVAAGGNINRRWPIERALRAGDAATGHDVLSELYRRMRDAPVEVDLPRLFRELGVSVAGGDVHYDDAAPLAELRRSFVLGAAAAAPSGFSRGR